MRIGRWGGQTLDAETLTARCHGLERAVEAAEDRVGGDTVGHARDVLARAGERLALSPDLTVVALAGSTGAGKSSLFNAIVGEDVATVAVTRPTTDRPSAGLWTEPSRAAGLLDWLSVPRWHAVDPVPEDPLAGLVLLDLPDHDSTATDHREQVDRIVARADVMVWVLDPQKYADALVHDSYLARFARHSEVTLVLLNQADRLGQADLRACLAHLRGLVAADGLPDARVLAVSARSGFGLPELREALVAVVNERLAVLTRLAADVAGAADALAAAAGDDGTAPASPSPAVRRALPEAMVDAAGVPLVESAVDESVRRAGALRTGWPPVRWVARLRRDPVERLRLGRAGVDPQLLRTSLPSASAVSLAEVSNAARTYAQAVTRGCPPPWVRSTRVLAASAADGIGPHLDAAVARAEVRAPKPPAWWSLVAVLQWLLLAGALAGLLWLLGLALLRALALVAPQPPMVGIVPVPTLLMVGGLLAGLLLALIARWATTVTARRAARRARAAVMAQVEEVARVRILEPVDAEVATLAQFRLGLLAARGD